MKLSPLSSLILSVVMASCGGNDRQELYDDIKSVDKLVLSSMTVTKTAKLDSEDWYTIGKRIAVYSYDTYLRAYIDLSTFQIDDMVFDDKTYTVRVTLPPVMTEISGRDMEMKKEYENIGPLRSELDSKERAEIKEIANASFRKEVSDNPEFRRRLTESAERKARKYFEALFEANGYKASIDFKTSPQ